MNHILPYIASIIGPMRVRPDSELSEQIFVRKLSSKATNPALVQGPAGSHLIVRPPQSLGACQVHETEPRTSVRIHCPGIPYPQREDGVASTAVER
jgi:hypothetical protein